MHNPDTNPIIPLTPGRIASISAAAQRDGLLDERGIPKQLGRQFRSLQTESGGSGYDEAKHTVTIALSSGEPVDRWYGTEILSHAKGAIRLDRLKQGIAMLFNHNMDDHLGISESFEIGSDGVLRVVFRFGVGPLAKEKEADVAARTLIWNSVGYLVHEWEIVEDTKTGLRTMTAVDWEPYEGSLVTVPADPEGSGVGRALSKEAVPIKVRSFRKLEEDDPEDPDDPDDPDAEGERTLAATDATTQAAGSQEEPAASSQASPTSTTTPEGKETPMEETVAVVRDLAAEKASRTLAITTLSTEYPDLFSADDAKRAIALDQEERTIKNLIFERQVAKASRSDVPTMADEVFGSMSERELDSYSLRNVYAAAVNKRMAGTFQDKAAQAGFEQEVGETLRKLAGERGINDIGAGIPVPSATTRALALSRLRQERTIASGGNAGQVTNFTNVAADPIELLRYRTACLALGARMMTGMHGAYTMPRQNGAGQSNWVLEGGNATETDPTLDSIGVKPNRLTMQNAYYRDFLAQSALAIDPFLSNDRNNVLARSLDSAGLAGPGIVPIPRGLLYQNGVAATLAGSTRAANGTYTAGQGGVPMTYVDYNVMESNISTANGDIGTLRWLTTPKVRAAGRSTPQIPGTASGFVFPNSKVGPGGLQEGPLGYDALCTSNPVLTGFTANSVSGLHAVILGVWDQMFFADWGLSEVIADPYTGAAQAMFKITEHAYYDTNIMHPECFCINESVLPA